MNITIRQATVADTAIITRFNKLMAAETENKTLDEKRLHKGVEAVLSDPSKGLYLLAELNGVVAGQAMVTYEWSDWRNGVFWWIQSVYVETSARGSGVFKSLYDHIHTVARANRAVCGLRLYVEKNNTRAKQTYERLGMKLSYYQMFEKDFVM
jgi:ribosomal protein S18 acetylase RimI-like enzyme